MSDAPILIVPYMWIGDFIRCHTVVELLRQHYPSRPIDMLTTAMVAPLLDYMPGVRQPIVADLPRKRIAFARHHALAERLRAQRYQQALVMPRTWKSALAPFLAGIPQRTGFVGEARFGLINDLRWGERRLPRMIDRCTALALPRGERPPAELPLPKLEVPAAEVTAWRRRLCSEHPVDPIVALAPGAVGPSKRWPYYAELARRLAGERISVWVVGGPAEKQVADEIVRADPDRIRDLTGSDLRNAVLALAAATMAVSNDSGLLHVAAALGTPVIGIFGPTSAWHWGPLNPIAGTMEVARELPCRPCHKPVCRLRHHLCMREITADRVARAVEETLTAVSARDRVSPPQVRVAPR